MGSNATKNIEVELADSNIRSLLEITRDKVTSNPTPEMWEAHHRARVIEKELKYIKPVAKDWMTLGGRLDPYAFGVGLSIFPTVLGGATVFVVTLAQIVQVVTDAPIITTEYFVGFMLAGATSFLGGLSGLLARNINLSSDKPQRVRRFFAKFLLTKKQKQIFAQRQEEWKMFELACKSHDLLVERRRRELVDNGYLELISKSAETEFFKEKLYLNDSGSFVWCKEGASSTVSGADYLSITKSIMKSLEETEQKQIKA